MMAANALAGSARCAGRTQGLGRDPLPRHTVGIADMRWARAKGTLITHGLGSCIAVCAYDVTTRVGAMLHFMLPDSQQLRQGSQRRPATFADTGIEGLLAGMGRAGVDLTRVRLRLVGGAAVLGGPAGFAVGKRNLLAARKLLWRRRLPIDAEEVGGSIARTVRLFLETGEVWVSTAGRPDRRL